MKFPKGSCHRLALAVHASVNDFRKILSKLAETSSKLSFVTVFGVFVCLILVPIASSASNAGSWPMAGGNEWRTGESNPNISFPTEPSDPWGHHPRILWKVDVLQPVGDPIITNDLVIITSYESGVYAFDLKTGELRWKNPVSPVLSGAVAGAGLVFVSDNYGNIHAFDASSGLRSWVTQLAAQDQSDQSRLVIVNAPLLFYGSTLYVPTRGSSLGVVALDAQSGDVKWIGRNVTTPPWKHGYIAADNRELYVPSWSGGLAIVSSVSGEVQHHWEFDGKDPRGGVLWTGSQAVSICAYDALCAFDPDSGLDWSTRPYPKERLTTPATSGDMIFSSSSSYVFALDAESGEELWSQPTFIGPIFSADPEDSPVVAGNLVIVASGRVAAFDRESGKLQWILSPPPPTGCGSASAHGAPAISGTDLAFISRSSFCESNVYNSGSLVVVDLMNLEQVPAGRQLSGASMISILVCLLGAGTFVHQFQRDQN